VLTGMIYNFPIGYCLCLFNISGRLVRLVRCSVSTDSTCAQQRCADPEMLRPHQSADSDHRSATASAGRCCLGSAVSPRVRGSLSDFDPCLHLTNRPNGLSTLPLVLRRICRGHKSKVMLPTAVNRSRQKQQSKYTNNQQLVFQVKSTKRTHEHSSHNPHASVPATWLLVHGCMVL